jgi:hypothetical protein
MCVEEVGFDWTDTPFRAQYRSWSGNVKSLVPALDSRVTSGSCCKECFALPTSTRKLKNMFMCGKLSKISNALQPVAWSVQLSHAGFVTPSGNMHISEPITVFELCQLCQLCHSISRHSAILTGLPQHSRKLSLAVVRRCWEPLRLWRTSHMLGTLWLDTKRLWYRVNKCQQDYTICCATQRD